MTPRRIRRVLPTAALLAASVIATDAQAPAPPAAAPAQPQAPAAAVVTVPSDSGRVSLTAGRSLVLTTPFEITRVAITNPAVADATVVAPTEILIDGKGAGTVTLIVWGAAQRQQYDVIVDRGVSELQQQLALIFPGEDIQASQTADAVILTGRASTNDVMLRAGEIATAVSPKSKILNLLQLPGGVISQQVMLQVRIAEVNRRAVKELGVSLFATGYKDYVVRATTQQFSAPEFDGGTATFGDLVNLFVFNTSTNLGVLIRALQSSGNFQALAEPNLIAYNGQEASFLAGGEVPIPVVQGATGTVTIQYREFGVRLGFRPTIAGDVIRLHVAPEVSALDFANGVTLGGFRVPALSTRKAETEIELRDGQSFAIAGLMNNIAQDTRQSIPLLSAIPIIGNLFKSKATNQDRTELLVIVTPRLVRPLNPDEVPPLPTSDDKFLQDSGPGASPAPGVQTPPSQ